MVFKCHVIRKSFRETGHGRGRSGPSTTTPHFLSEYGWEQTWNKEKSYSSFKLCNSDLKSTTETIGQKELRVEYTKMDIPITMYQWKLGSKAGQ